MGAERRKHACVHTYIHTAASNGGGLGGPVSYQRGLVPVSNSNKGVTVKSEKIYVSYK